MESGLGFTCKLKSSVPFQGRERLERQKQEGLRRRIVCFTIDESVKLVITCQAERERKEHLMIL